MSRALSAAEVLALPAAVDLVTAGRALGIGRTTAEADRLPARGWTAAEVAERLAVPTQ
ncbi:hypothetical protein [Streptomyces sp. NRRL S-813]|uniref:hypothetical protein n=1 Tax=Streptomyces sp. NRRL S-813 TaxID=1463919 RepID=UPI000B2CBEE7|nr:hypothetical protein [Streptomyces sp. NRRL S-813]